MALKLKFRSIFPALVTASSPLTLVKTGLAYAFGFDVDALRATLDADYVTSLNGRSGPQISYYAPQGRLTLTSGIPVLQTSVAAATTVYYALYAGNLVPLYDGTNMVPTAFTELSQATTDATKSPAACATNSNYYNFVWNDPAGNVKRCTRGPAWTSNTNPGTGAGTSELIWVNGIPLNKYDITNGPAAQRGTCVGGIHTNGTSTVDYIFGTVASGGGMATFGVDNIFNRVDIKTMVGDSTTSWPYAVATWRAPNANATMRVNMFRALNEDGIQAEYDGIGSPAGATTTICGVGLDSTSVVTGTTGYNNIASSVLKESGKYSGLPGLGFHFVSALEFSSSGTWFGSSSQLYQSGLHFSGKA